LKKQSLLIEVNKDDAIASLLEVKNDFRSRIDQVDGFCKSSIDNFDAVVRRVEKLAKENAKKKENEL
jgi:hypothetical protein